MDVNDKDSLGRMPHSVQNPTVCKAEGSTSFMVAAWLRTEILELLHENFTIGINFQDNKGNTALHKAARSQILIRRGPLSSPG